MFKTIQFSRKNLDSLVKKEYVCIYDDSKVSRDTAWSYCRRGQESRNVLIMTRQRFSGVMENLLEEANKNIKTESEAK